MKTTKYEAIGRITGNVLGLATEELIAAWLAAGGAADTEVDAVRVGCSLDHTRFDPEFVVTLRAVAA